VPAYAGIESRQFGSLQLARAKSSERMKASWQLKAVRICNSHGVGNSLRTSPPARLHDARMGSSVGAEPWARVMRDPGTKKGSFSRAAPHGVARTSRPARPRKSSSLALSRRALRRAWLPPRTNGAFAPLL
jgi:hypothetical protein